MATIDDRSGAADNLLPNTGVNFDYTANGRPVIGQDRAVLLLGQALENVDPERLSSSTYATPILRDPRTPAGPLLTVGEFAAQLEAEFGLSPADWPGQTTPYNATQSGQYDFDSVNALLQSLGDQLAADNDTTIPFNFVRPDSYVVLGDETAHDIAHQYGLNGSAVANESNIPQRQQQARELIQNLRSRLTELDSRINGDGTYSPGYSTDIWSDSNAPKRSFRDYLENVFNPALTRLTGDSLEDAVRPFGLNSLYASNGEFSEDSVRALQGAITDYETRGIDNSIGAGRVVDLSAANLTSTPLTSAEREARLNAVLDDFVTRLTNFEPEIDYNPNNWFSSNWGDVLDQPNSVGYSRWNTEPGKPASGNQSFQQYLNNYLNPQLEELSGSTLEELVLPFGLGSLYDTSLTNDFRSTGNNPHFTLESRDNLLEALGRYRSSQLPDSSHAALLNQLAELEREFTQLSTHPFFQPSHAEYKGVNGTLSQDGLRGSLADVVDIEFLGSKPSTRDYLRQVDDRLRSLTGQTLAELLPNHTALLSQQNLSQADLQSLARAATTALFDAQTPAERNRTDVIPALADAAFRLQRYRSHPFLVQFEAGERASAPGTGFVSSVFEDGDGNNRHIGDFLANDVNPILLRHTGKTFDQITAEGGYTLPSAYSFEAIDRTLDALNTFIEDRYGLRVNFDDSEALADLVSGTNQTSVALGSFGTAVTAISAELNAARDANSAARTTAAQQVASAAGAINSNITTLRDAYNNQLTALQSTLGTAVDGIRSESRATAVALRQQVEELTRPTTDLEIDTEVAAWTHLQYVQSQIDLASATDNLNERAAIYDGLADYVNGTLGDIDLPAYTGDSIQGILDLTGTLDNLTPILGTFLGVVAYPIQEGTVRIALQSVVSSLEQSIETRLTSDAASDSSSTNTLDGSVLSNLLAVLPAGDGKDAIVDRALDFLVALEDYDPNDPVYVAHSLSAPYALRDAVSAINDNVGINVPDGLVTELLSDLNATTTLWGGSDTALLNEIGSQIRGLFDNPTAAIAQHRSAQPLINQLSTVVETLDTLPGNISDFVARQGNFASFDPSELRTLAANIQSGVDALDDSSLDFSVYLTDTLEQLLSVPNLSAGVTTELNNIGLTEALDQLGNFLNAEDVLGNGDEALTSLQARLTAVTTEVAEARAVLRAGLTAWQTTLSEQPQVLSFAALATPNSADTLTGVDTNIRTAFNNLDSQLNAISSAAAAAGPQVANLAEAIPAELPSELAIDPDAELAALSGRVQGDIAGTNPTFREYLTDLQGRLQNLGLNLGEELADRGVTLDLTEDIPFTQLQAVDSALNDLGQNLRTEVFNQIIEGAQPVADPGESADEYVTAIAGNITRGENGAFYVDGEQRSVIRIAAELRLQSIDDEAERSAELLQALNARVEKSALGTEILDLLATLEQDNDGNYETQASLWARGDVDSGTETAFAAGLRALAEEYNVDDPFAAFLPNYELNDATEYTHEDITALTNAIGAFQDTATRDNERDNLAIQESHTKLNVLLENLNAIIGLISKLSELIRNIG